MLKRIGSLPSVTTLSLFIVLPLSFPSHSASNPAKPDRANVGGCADNGKTVYDPVHKVCWLADANLAATEKLGVSGINQDGSMNFEAAQSWVNALNEYDHGNGWLGHNNWLLPTTTADDPHCTRQNPVGGGGFAYNCSASGLGALYYQVLHDSARTNVLPISGSVYGPFRNLQPNLYWSATVSADSRQGYQTFSFNTGWQGANTKTNVLFVLLMAKGRLPDIPTPKSDDLELSPDGKTVYDPIAGITWVADANLAATHSFQVAGVGSDGAMDWDTALRWTAELRNATYAGSNKWELPDIGTCGGYACRQSALAQLYAHLHLSPGESVNNAGASIGGFQNLQPYFYWGCNGYSVPGPCTGGLPRNMGWNFSFANGFQGTALPINAFYVLPYYPLEQVQSSPGSNKPPLEPRRRRQ
jgi:hypothetical protein